MPIPSSNVCYYAATASYAPGGGIDLVPYTTPRSMVGGTSGQIGFDSWAYNGGSGGQAGRLRIWDQATNTWYDSVQVSPGMAVPFTATYTLPLTGTRNYAFSIWTDSSAYGSTFTNLWMTHPSCTGTGPVPCLPRLKPGQDVQVWVTDALLAAIAAPITGANYVLQLMRFSIGQVITIENLCTLTPPIVPTLDGSMWGSPFTMAHWGGVYLEALAWWYFCECTTGTGPVLPPPPPITDTPYRPDDPVYTPNPSNPCLDLTEVRRKLDQLLAITKSDLDADTILQRYSLPFGAIPGAVHSALSGSGTFLIPRCVGLRIEWTGGAAADTWEGTPPYYKDLGWVSANDGGAMLLERRVTRTSEDWMPRGFQLATQVGYFAKPGVTLKITELYAEP